MRGEDAAEASGGDAQVGSPPHARGRQGRLRRGWLRSRITPACAGKTEPSESHPLVTWDHPRMRGEDRVRGLRQDQVNGSPPHARGRLGRPVRWRAWARITPACAGKTPSEPTTRRPGPDHPRMRGEDVCGELARRTELGSPPHARGRHLVEEFSGWCGGITPACAGKTQQCRRVLGVRRDHPRMRGEDDESGLEPDPRGGSPPHARGRPGIAGVAVRAGGITPACAGKTCANSSASPKPTDHPRMRGEDVRTPPEHFRGRGSPPHARGRPHRRAVERRSLGITPACAGKTPTPQQSTGWEADHPRMRGEDAASWAVIDWISGSPPHARGRQLDSPGNPAKSFSAYQFSFALNLVL